MQRSAEAKLQGMAFKATTGLKKSFVFCWTGILLCLFTSELFAQTPLPAEVNYDIIYVRAPRLGDDTLMRMPEVFDPIKAEPGTDLMLLHPDGTEEVLVAGGDGAVMDPVLSFDGKWVYYSKIHDQTDLEPQRRNPARSGADIFKLNLETRETVQLTFQEWTPNTGVADWTDNPSVKSSTLNSLGYGIYNLGPCPLPGGKLMFTSSRNSFLPNKSFTFPNLQLFVMDDDGKNVELVGHLNLGSALHPTVLKDGRVMFSSYEAQGKRDQRLWALWSIWPDGRKWAPLVSAFSDAGTFHWQAQLSDGSIVVDHYYNLNNNGFGTFVKLPVNLPPGEIAFGDPNAFLNEGLPMGWHANGNVRLNYYSFKPYGLESLTPFTWERDSAAPFIHGDGPERTGKVAQPSGAPDNDLLLVWSPGPANSLERPTNRPTYDAGLYLIPGGNPVHDHRDLIEIKNDPAYNEQQPRAVLPYSAIYGIEEPAQLSWLPNDGTRSTELPAGTPYGLIGTSSFYKRDTKPGEGVADFDGLDPFNTYENGASSNWGLQGADAGKYNNSDIHAVRILAMEPTSHLSYGPNNFGLRSGDNFRNEANERLRILGEIPLRKFDGNGNPVLDPEGNPDTSFLAKIPADVPFTFQTIDKDGAVLNMAQTWHQVRPGEIRTDCGGCHAHSQEPLDFSNTAAAQPGYVIQDLANTTPMLTRDAQGNPDVEVHDQGAVDVEYYRDIKPILERSCVQCHSVNGPMEANLALDDVEIINKYENTYNRLADDRGYEYGIPPLVTPYGWRQTNQSRYIRTFQSRRSLLVWKIFGKRMDGWTNADHPTASIPGDPTSLPGGGSQSEINRSDLDFTGTIMPPPGSGVPPLTEDEKMLFARWVDLGTPITRHEPSRQRAGWFGDELRPTVALSRPRAGSNPPGLDHIRLGMHDFYTGLDGTSLEVVASFPVNGVPAGDNLASLFAQTADHVWTLNLDTPVQVLADATLTVKIKDQSGNLTQIDRTFSVGLSGGLPVTNDFTADGQSDLLASHDTEGDIVTVLLDNSVIQSSGELLQIDPASGWSVHATGDFDGDRKSDLVIHNSDTGEVIVLRMNGTAFSSGEVVHTLAPASGLEPRGVGDFDGDGNAEIIVYHPVTGDLSLAFLNGGTTVSSIDPVGQVDVANGWTLQDTGDFNRDGNTDFLLYNALTGAIAVWEMDGANILATTEVTTLNLAETFQGTGDFDGDQDTDFISRNSSGRITVHTLEGLAETGSFEWVTLPVEQEILNTGNYNADNKSDLLVEDATTGDIITIIQDGGPTPPTQTVLTTGPNSGWTFH